MKMMKVREQKIRDGGESKRFIEKKRMRMKKREEEEGGFLTSGSQPRNSKAELKNWAGTGGFTIFFL